VMVPRYNNRNEEHPPFLEQEEDTLPLFSRRTLKSIGLGCRESRCLIGITPTPTLPHQGEGFTMSSLCEAICETLH
jgi:hypothetical protein